MRSRRHFSSAAEQVVIERRDGDWWVVSDEESEFARATTITEALRYASDLLHGPGTAPKGSLEQYVPAADVDRLLTVVDLVTAKSERRRERLASAEDQLENSRYVSDCLHHRVVAYEAAIRHVLRHGKIGKQSARRLQEALDD